MTLAYYGKSKQRQALLAIVTFFAVAIGIVAAGAWQMMGADAASVTPIALPNATATDTSPTCGTQGQTAGLDSIYGGGQTWLEFKIEPPGDGVYVEGSLIITISNYVASANGTPGSFTWSSNFGVDAVLVKAGSDKHNLYVYAPTAASTESVGDSGLGPQAAATSTGGNGNGISHISFCYDGGEVTQPAPTFTKTAGDGDSQTSGDQTYIGADAFFNVTITSTASVAQTVKITDADTTFMWVLNNTGGTCSATSGVTTSPYTCTVNANSSMTVVLRKTATQLAQCEPTDVENTATAALLSGPSDTSPGTPITSSDNTETVTIPQTGTPESCQQVIAPSITKTAVDGDPNAQGNQSANGVATWEIAVQNNSQTSMAVVVNDAGALFGSQTSAVGTGSCSESTGNASPFDCTVSGSSTLKFTVTKTATNATCEPTTIDNQATVSWWDGESSQTSQLTASAPIQIPVTRTDCNPTPRQTIQVCKVIVGNGDNVANNGTFGFTVSGGNPDKTSFSRAAVEGAGTSNGTESCETVTVDANATAITITESSKPGGWTDSAGYPKHQVNDLGPLNGSSVEIGMEEVGCYDTSVAGLRRTESIVALDFSCKVTFFNRTDGQVAAAPKLTIKKVITTDASTTTAGNDTPGQGWSFNLQCGTQPAAVVGQTDATGTYFVGSTSDNVTCTISEVTQSGYSLIGWTRQDTSNNSAGANTGAANSVTILMNNDDDNVVTFYNRPLGSITVLKFEVNTPANGWTFTLNPSAACGIGPVQGVTAGNGTYTFNNLPLAVNGCSYTVTETVKNGWTVVGGATKNVTGPATAGANAQVTFVNQPITPTPTVIPPCTDCVPVVIVTPTPTNTPVPPTPTVVPPTNTPSPTPVETIAGARTPGALSTPIAPSTGTGAAGSTSSMNLFMATIGLLIVGAGLATIGASRKRG